MVRPKKYINIQINKHVYIYILYKVWKKPKSDILTTSVMLRIFLFIVSLSWLAVGVNHSFWNVSFTSFCREEKIVQLKLTGQTYHNKVQHSGFHAKQSREQDFTLMPSSSLTLRIIFTHISVILLKLGCSKQMSLRILITLFLTLIPVSWRDRRQTL